MCDLHSVDVPHFVKLEVRILVVANRLVIDNRIRKWYELNGYNDWKDNKKQHLIKEIVFKVVDKREEKSMKSENRMINEMIGQLYQDEKLRKCFYDEIKVQPERIKKLYEIIMNCDRLSGNEIKEMAYRYAESIQENELLARQIFLCLLRLSEM